MQYLLFVPELHTVFHHLCELFSLLLTPTFSRSSMKLSHTLSVVRLRQNRLRIRFFIMSSHFWKGDVNIGACSILIFHAAPNCLTGNSSDFGHRSKYVVLCKHLMYLCLLVYIFLDLFRENSVVIVTGRVFHTVSVVRSQPVLFYSIFLIFYCRSVLGLLVLRLRCNDALAVLHLVIDAFNSPVDQHLPFIRCQPIQELDGANGIFRSS